MSRLKGHLRRKVTPPGYQIKPRYDLKGLRARQEEKKHKKSVPSLPLTALIDIFSMLVIFLLMNFSATGEIFFMSKEGLHLPEASYTRPLETMPLVSITSRAVTIDYPGMSTFRVNNPLSNEDLLRLSQKLRSLKSLFVQPSTTGMPSSPQVNLQADQRTPLGDVKRIMNILISEGLGEINFAVTRIESGAEH